MGKLGQLLGLTALETFQMSTFQANLLALNVQDAMLKEAMNNPAAMSGPMRRAVRSRSERLVRSMRESRRAVETGEDTVVGPPPDEL